MIFKIVGAALIFAILAYMLRELGFRAAPAFAALSLVFIIRFSTESLKEIFPLFSLFSEYDGVGKSLSAALKIIGATYAFGICADICRTLGEGSIAKAVEVVGRVEIFLVVLPFLEEIIRLGVDLI